MGSAPSLLSIVRVTSARPRAGRPEVPAKTTSSILPPRSGLAPCSPITQENASTTFDLPDPFGPTTQVIPGSKRSDVAEANDLNPRKVRVFRYTRGFPPPPPPPLPGPEPRAASPPPGRRHRALRYLRAGPVPARAARDRPAFPHPTASGVHSPGFTAPRAGPGASGGPEPARDCAWARVQRGRLLPASPLCLVASGRSLGERRLADRNQQVMTD